MSKISLKILIEFCKDVLDEDFADYYKKVYLKTYYFPNRKNGHLIKFKNSKYCVSINLYSIYNKYRYDTVRLFFYLYTTLMHELKHILIFENTRLCNYSEWISFFEMKHLYTHYKAHKKIRLNINRTDGVFITELMCHQYGFEKSIKAFEHIIDKTMLDEVNTIHKAIKLSLKCIEIDFDKRYSYNKFDYIVKHTKKSIKTTNRNDVNLDVGILWNDGNLRSLDEIYKLRTIHNKELIDELLIKYFVNIASDYETIFINNTNLKKHIERLLEEYIERIETFVKEEHLIRIILEEKEYKENKKYILKTLKRLFKKISVYNLNVNSEYYLPLY